MIRFLAVAALLLLTGCATQLRVTYYSDPPGAVLYADEQRIGYTPQTLRYDVSEEAKGVGYLTLPPMRVRWVSGAESGIGPHDYDLAERGLYGHYTFVRPEDVPGADTDLGFALELERVIALRQQVAAQAALADALWFQTELWFWGTRDHRRWDGDRRDRRDDRDRRDGRDRDRRDDGRDGHDRRRPRDGTRDDRDDHGPGDGARRDRDERKPDDDARRGRDDDQRQQDEASQREEKRRADETRKAKAEESRRQAMEERQKSERDKAANLKAVQETMRRQIEEKKIQPETRRQEPAKKTKEEESGKSD